MPASLIKWQKGGLKNPMARARGLGSAHDGVHHWSMQRLTAILNVPLVAWFLWAMTQVAGLDHQALMLWVAEPLHAIPLILCVLSFFYHAVVGFQVVLEDYIHHEGMKLAAPALLRITMLVMAVACLFSILKMAL